jgi:hypothetical protein
MVRYRYSILVLIAEALKGLRAHMANTSMGVKPCHGCDCF